MSSHITNRQKLIVIVGPTASGKSELAVQIAKKFDGEIISGDSRQIYRGLNLSTGKVAGKWKKGTFFYKEIPHHCIDFISPKKTFTVAEYQKCAEAAINEIAGRYKIPILVGGTGFWIDAVVYDLDFPEVVPNLELRKKLEKKSARTLLAILKKFDPKRTQDIEQKNLRRLIRAIEIAKALGRVPSIQKHSPYQTLWTGLNLSYETRTHRIAKRVAAMIKHGIIQETKKLMAQKISRRRIHEFGFEYRAVLDYLDRKISKKELHERIVKDSLQYARRQMVWWKRNKKIHWIEKPDNADSRVRQFLANRNKPS